MVIKDAIFLLKEMLFFFKAFQVNSFQDRYKGPIGSYVSL